jgi:hypothetical protein
MARAEKMRLRAMRVSPMRRWAFKRIPPTFRLTKTHELCPRKPNLPARELRAVPSSVLPATQPTRVGAQPVGPATAAATPSPTWFRATTPYKTPAGVKKIDEWFNTACFQLQPYGTMGKPEAQPAHRSDDGTRRSRSPGQDQISSQASPNRCSRGLQRGDKLTEFTRLSPSDCSSDHSVNPSYRVVMTCAELLKRRRNSH